MMIMMMMMRMRVQKVASNSLKIGYIIVLGTGIEELDTSLSTAKLIWVYKLSEV